jgi:hypothetical protein
MAQKLTVPKGPGPQHCADNQYYICKIGKKIKVVGTGCQTTKIFENRGRDRERSGYRREAAPSAPPAPMRSAYVTYPGDF